jgi:hypothetical protein
MDHIKRLQGSTAPKQKRGNTDGEQWVDKGIHRTPPWSAYHGMDLYIDSLIEQCDGVDPRKFNGWLAMAVVAGPRTTIASMRAAVDQFNLFAGLLLTATIPSVLEIPTVIRESDSDGLKEYYMWSMSLAIFAHIFCLCLGCCFCMAALYPPRDVDIYMWISRNSRVGVCNLNHLIA